MRSALRDLGLGLMIGMCATGLVAIAIVLSLGNRAPLAAAQPAPTDTATPTIAFTPTITSTPTLTPSPTLTFTPSPSPTATATATLSPLDQMIRDGSLSFAGPLSNVDQIHLYQASLKYIATTPADARRVSKEINGVGYGDPSNICGPLAIAILRDAGLLLTAEVIPHDFWLLNPVIPEDRRTLSTAFPPDHYDYSRIITPLNKMDWRAAPLVPGDFLFIWHGSWGNFDHMLVITRVDNLGRAYAVTNYGTKEGYIISEALLYDPADPGLGLFHTWTQEQYAILGSTGFGGFELWRRR